jgi:hypothetical protein
MLEDWGLGCISAHWSGEELFQNADKSIDYAREFGNRLRIGDPTCATSYGS